MQRHVILNRPNNWAVWNCSGLSTFRHAHNTDVVHVGSGATGTDDETRRDSDDEAVEVINILGGGREVRPKDNLPKFERDGTDKYVQWRCEEDKSRLNEKMDRMLQGQVLRTQ